MDKVAHLPEKDRNELFSEAAANLFESPECSVKVIKAERTFWEKATILHHEVHRPEGNHQPKRYSRHYSDLAKMAE